MKFTEVSRFGFSDLVHLKGIGAGSMTAVLRLSDNLLRGLVLKTIESGLWSDRWVVFPTSKRLTLLSTDGRGH